MHLIHIKSKDLPLLQQFIASLGEGAKSFRYFDKRPIEVVLNHLFAGLLIEDSAPVAYGHLDREGDTLWLGIAVSENYRGQGIGRQMLVMLLQQAVLLNEKSIFLTVDKTNYPAIRLYEQVGFLLQEEGPTYYKYWYTTK